MNSVVNKMKVKYLPEYSTERYYLLSEIEQRSKFYFLDEDENMGEQEKNEMISSRFRVVYILWSFSDSNDTIIDKLNKIADVLKKQPDLMLTTVLVFEYWLKSREHWIDAENSIQDIFSYACQSLNFGFVCGGVCDKSSGTSGLELCLDYLALFPEYDHTKAVIFGISRQDCLGHEPSREPDATSGVYQLQCFNDQTDLIEWGTERCKKVFPDFHLIVSKQMKEIDNNNYSGMNIIFIVLILLISVYCFFFMK